MLTLAILLFFMVCWCYPRAELVSIETPEAGVTTDTQLDGAGSTGAVEKPPGVVVTAPIPPHPPVGRPRGEDEPPAPGTTPSD